MSGTMIQFGESAGQLFQLNEDGTRQGVLQPEAPAPAPREPAKVVARIGLSAPQPEPTAKPGSFKADLRARRRFVVEQVKALRQYETELGEIDRMLAAIKTTKARK
jgi:hypothetical protein